MTQHSYDYKPNKDGFIIVYEKDPDGKKVRESKPKKSRAEAISDLAKKAKKKRGT